MKVFIQRPILEEKQKQEITLKPVLYLIFAEDESTKDKETNMKHLKEIISFASQYTTKVFQSDQNKNQCNIEYYF